MSNAPLKVVFLDRDTIAPQTVLRAPGFAHTLETHARTAPDQVVERIADADIVLVNKVRLGAQELAAAPRLKMIALAATGSDNVDLQACNERGIVVSNIRGYAVRTVPEHVFALMFALQRSIVAYRQSVQAGRWQQAAQFCYFDYPVRDLAGSNLGIIGAGALGQAVAQIGRALGMNVRFAAHKGRTDMGALYTPFDTILAESDVITLHCPLTEHTRHLLGEAEFAKMARKPLIINTARGALIDDHALAAALRSGQISGAGIDVTVPEPPPADHPLMQLLDLPNFILTPHVAWASNEAMQTLADQLIDNIEAFVAGRPRNVLAGATTAKDGA
ncbi:D-2-hydroxyacid dehydrogenase [Yanghanlia caeni]|uniref:D-2-hydroxyacid dehydrogenase n=1 Tax=Yanghanlia caeni TaxID=3064283 RepID=A0ABU1D5M9_9BURK|nr:D-2-hydroxyacid dehydrogenase [Alcaligenaceae bacterium LG-2]